MYWETQRHVHVYMFFTFINQENILILTTDDNRPIGSQLQLLENTEDDML